MSAVVMHFASGAAFFSGSICLLAGLLAITFGRRKGLQAAGRLLLLVSLFLIVASATPLPFWPWCLWAASLAFCLGALRPRFSARSRWRMGALAAAVGCTAAAVGWEFPFHLRPRLPAGPFNRLVVIGDSLSAQDFTEGGDPWPRLLARDHRIEVVNLAFSGAKAGSAAKRAADEDFTGALVVLEIGGNDLLGSASPEQFEEDLDRLLGTVCRSAKTTAMLELPLPPLYNRFGAIQRRLARRHGVVLIPKRYFAGVLTGEEATIDRLHLSPAGHRRMADTIWSLVGQMHSSRSAR
jgi:acyl-CoA thioesterase-1